MASSNRTRQLSDLRNDVVFLADLPTPTTTSHITTANLTDLVNAGIAEMFNLVVSEVGDDVYRNSTTITTDGTNTIYALPNETYRVTEVTLTVNTNDKVNMTRMTAQERAFLSSQSPGWDGTPYKYDIVGKNTLGGSGSFSIEFLPLPTAGQTLLVYYVFCPARLVNNTDVVDGFAGFEDYAVLFAASRCQMRRGLQDEAAALKLEMARVKENILNMMKNRDGIHPPKTQIIRDNYQPRSRWWGR